MRTLWRALVLTIVATGVTSAPAMADDDTAPGCHGGPAFIDVRYEFGSPYSFTDGPARVSHFQWRRADDNWAEVRTSDPDTTITLHRSDGAVCGPYRVHRFAGEYRARTGYLPNTGHGVWACISYSSGGACGDAKKE